MNAMIDGMTSTSGSVLPFSQLRTVRQLTPSRSAAALWLSPHSRRRFLTCSPSVRGSKSVSFGFSALRVTGRHGKKATRPCPCGFLGHYSGKCHCTPEQVARYRRRISGPLLDRIDMLVEVTPISSTDIPFYPKYRCSMLKISCKCVRRRPLTAGVPRGYRRRYQKIRIIGYRHVPHRYRRAASKAQEQVVQAH